MFGDRQVTLYAIFWSLVKKQKINFDQNTFVCIISLIRKRQLSQKCKAPGTAVAVVAHYAGIT